MIQLLFLAGAKGSELTLYRLHAAISFRPMRLSS